MAKKTEKTNASGILLVKKLTQGFVEFHIVGESPLLFRQMAAKARQSLLNPPPSTKGSTNKADKIKHDPIREFRDSMGTLPGGPTLACLPATAFKGAIMSAAVEDVGSTKAQMGRLTNVEGEYVPIWGKPMIHSDMVRLSGQNRTPDVRTWAIMPEWATKIMVRYVTPPLNGSAIGNLLANAGIFIGVGDGRPEKGKKSFGRFRIADKDDSDYKRITEQFGRQPQVEALSSPDYYTEETKELLSEFFADIANREMSNQITLPTNGKEI